QVHAAELRDGVVAVLDEDAGVELLGPGQAPRGPTAGRPPVPDRPELAGELVEEQAAQRLRRPRVAGEECALHDLGEVDEGEDRAVEVGEVGSERAALGRREGVGHSCPAWGADPLMASDFSRSGGGSATPRGRSAGPAPGRERPRGAPRRSALDSEEDRRTLAVDEEQRRLAVRPLLDRAPEILHGAHRLAIDLGNNVAGPDAGFGGRAAVLDLAHHEAVVDGDAELARDVRRERLDREPELDVLAAGAAPGRR